MKLLRFGEAGAEKPGAIDADGRIRDLSAHVDDIGPDELDDAVIERLRALDLSSLPAVPASIRRGPPVSNIRKVICIGLNYSDHAAESGMAIPEEPVVFMKADTSITGPGDNVIIPRLSWVSSSARLRTTLKRLMHWRMSRVTVLSMMYPNASSNSREPGSGSRAKVMIRFVRLGLN